LVSAKTRNQKTGGFWERDCLTTSLFLAQDAKFGFGGVKKGMKRNSSQSFSDVSSFNSAKHSKAPRAKSGNVVSLHLICLALVLLDAV